MVNGEAYPIAGVAAPGFLGVSLDSAGDIWLLSPQFRAAATFAVARLRAGVPIEHAAAATAGPLDQADLARPGASQGPIQTTVVPGGQGTSNLRERYRAPLVALMGLVVLVLLVTCANLANLLVVRNVNRARELHVRTALGAGRTRLIRQLLMEGVMLAVLGAVAAWVWRVKSSPSFCQRYLQPKRRRVSRFTPMPRILAFMSAATLLHGADVCAAAGVARLPGRRLVRASKRRTAQDAPRGARRLGLAMVGVQVALSVLLLTAAAIFGQTVRNVSTMPLGFDRRQLIEVELADRVLRLTAADVREIHDALLDGIRALPGVEHVALSHPLFPPWAFGIAQPDGEAGSRISVDYFSAMKIPLIRGRLLTPDDLARQDPVVVVNDGTREAGFPAKTHQQARRLQQRPDRRHRRQREHDQRALGRTDGVSAGAALGSQAGAGPHRQSGRLWSPRIAVRPDRTGCAAVNPRLLVAVRTPEEALNRSIARERMVAATSGFFGLTGLALAGLGLFGVAASAVAHRTRSSAFASRSAPAGGASCAKRSAARPSVFAGGLAAGIGATMIATRQLDHLIAGLLIGLRPSDWMMVAAATTALLVVATLAAILPALRAARVDPLIAMRAD